MQNNVEKGDYGEKLAEEFLYAKGYKILETKYRNPFGEIDIIAEDKEYIVFTEVKYRNNLENGYPREAVNKAKQRRLRKTALGYISINQIVSRDFRFDVIEILNLNGINIEHIENAF